jgi:hypothetical protein
MLAFAERLTVSQTMQTDRIDSARRWFCNGFSGANSR